MESEAKEWLHLILRWIHVIAGIMWIGQTYLFNWMERVLEAPKGPGKENISGELWMVHGGGFYLVEKQKWPELMPKTLHWFKWESFFTWLTGFFLLMLVYWFGAPLLEYGSTMPRGQAIAISAAVLVGGFLVYDTFWRIPLFAGNEPLGLAVCWVMLCGLIWGLDQVFSDRAVYLHVGAMFGTIMVTNVWMRILPSQRKMIEITKAGGTPDQRLAARARRCSKHNTYMSVPLLFTMISSHFPAATFGGDHHLIVLAVLLAVGFASAKLIRDVL